MAVRPTSEAAQGLQFAIRSGIPCWAKRHDGTLSCIVGGTSGLEGLGWLRCCRGAFQPRLELLRKLRHELTGKQHEVEYERVMLQRASSMSRL